ncbi:MAG: TetR/AcrR family transcriptional regulator, partial [SAR324 cluster bacterium]|nr:TetR/AcrR family transcriptional regulator [SAR324 cluster bacterium]
MSLKERIVQEGLRLFSLNGFLSTSLHDILAAANTSKGGFYNHFKSKEELFFAVVDRAGIIWRERNLKGLDESNSPVERLRKLLENYRDRYLKDAENFPGGCVFITLSADLNDQRPHLSAEIDKGMNGLKDLIRRILEAAKQTGELKEQVDTNDATEMIFNAMLGASIRFSDTKSAVDLDRTIG